MRPIGFVDTRISWKKIEKLRNIGFIGSHAFQESTNRCLERQKFFRFIVLQGVIAFEEPPITQEVQEQLCCPHLFTCLSLFDPIHFEEEEVVFAGFSYSAQQRSGF